MRASDFVKKRPSKTLTIFDIDDTLFHTTAKIKVIKDGEVVRTLSNQEFNNYNLQPDEEFDFGEFRDAKKFAQESEPIDHMLDELKTILDHTQGKVIMLTARADFDNKETFLKTFTSHGIDMSRIHVHRAGNIAGNAIPAEKKAVWVRKYLETGNYNQVSLYDDSMSNLRVFKSLKKEFPDVDFDAYYITDKDVQAVEGQAFETRKRRKRRYAAYGPGPYGWYGADAGYSGDGGGGGGDGGGESRTNEASYPGNIGIMELAKFFKTATPEQQDMFKKLVSTGEKKLAWFLIQRVTGVKLRGGEFNENAAPEKTNNDKNSQAVLKLKSALLAKKKLLQSASDGQVYDIIDDIMTGIAKSHNISGKELHNLWVKKYNQIPDKWIMTENFADGKNPQDKGDSKRYGVPTKAPVSTLRKVAKQGGRKGQLAHWMANMKSGKQKSK